MPRSKVVTVNGKTITVKESKIRELRDDVMPKLTGSISAEELAGKEIKDIVPFLMSKITEIFPEVTEADIEESYMSELEALIEAWVNVNFTGIKRIYKPALALIKMASVK